jgi:hypothetical protein
MATDNELSEMLIHKLESYKNDKDPVKRDLASNWLTSIGLQKVDGLKVSKYLMLLAIRNIEGELSFEDVQELLRQRHDENKMTF